MRNKRGQGDKWPKRLIQTHKNKKHLCCLLASHHFISVHLRCVPCMQGWSIFYSLPPFSLSVFLSISPSFPSCLLTLFRPPCLSPLYLFPASSLHFSSNSSPSPRLLTPPHKKCIKRNVLILVFQKEKKRKKENRSELTHGCLKSKGIGKKKKRR